MHVTLPHCWNAEDGQGSRKEMFTGKCWYQRKLITSHEDLNKFLFLEIGAASIVSEVYINGHLAKSNKCAYSMYRVSLNEYLNVGDNLISVMVDNSQYDDVYPLMADFSFYGGLYRDVKLIIAKQLHFDLLDNSRDGIYLTQKKIGENSYSLNINGSVINEIDNISDATIKFELFNKENHRVLNKAIDIRVSKSFEFNLTETLLEVILWQGIENPYLYTLKATLYHNEKIYDSRKIQIGFRCIEMTPDKGLLLNDKHIKINGVSRHQDFAGVGNAITKEHMDLDMSIIKEIGANSIRLAHYQHDDYFYSLCDREGLLVWAEIPFISVPTIVDKENKNANDQLEKLIKQAYNHSSIYCWGVQNEITMAVENENIYKQVKELVTIAETLDPSRMTAQANIYSVSDGSKLNQLTNLVGYNLYYGWYYKEIEDLGKRLDDFHKTSPHIPVLVSEYGVDTNPKFHSYEPKVKDYTEEYQLLYTENALRTFNERAFVLGGYVWNMFDFGSDIRDEGGKRGQNLKGLVTIDRLLKKDSFYLYKAYWSKTPFVYITGRRFVNRHKASNDIIVLSNIDNVKLYASEKTIGQINNKNAVKCFKDVKLDPGENVIRVEGYDNNKNLLFDEIILNYTKKIDKSYHLPKIDNQRNVTNWFEKFDLTNVQEVNLKEGYYSTHDIIKELFENEEAKAVFIKYFDNTAEHPKFKAMMELTTIEDMAKISRFNIPKELLSVINRELNKIPKNKV